MQLSRLSKFIFISLLFCWSNAQASWWNKLVNLLESLNTPITTPTYHFGDPNNTGINGGGTYTPNYRKFLPPYNRQVGRGPLGTEANCLYNFRLAGDGEVYTRICAEDPGNNSATKHKIKLRNVSCLAGCWYENFELDALKSECKFFAAQPPGTAKYMFPIIARRICARIATPASDEYSADPGYMQGVDSAGRTRGQHLDTYGVTQWDDLVTDKDGNGYAILRPKICAYDDPWLIDLWTGPGEKINQMTIAVKNLLAGQGSLSDFIQVPIDIFDINPKSQPFHGGSGISSPVANLIISLLQFYISYKTRSAQMLEMMVSMIASAAGIPKEGSEAMGIIFQVMNFMMTYQVSTVLLIIQANKEVNKFAYSNYGCINIPLGDYPPNYCPTSASVVTGLLTPICSTDPSGNLYQNCYGLVSTQTDQTNPYTLCSETKCVQSNYDNNFLNNSARIGYTHPVQGCSTALSTNCVNISASLSRTSVMQNNNFILGSALSLVNVGNVTINSTKQYRVLYQVLNAAQTQVLEISNYSYVDLPDCGSIDNTNGYTSPTGMGSVIQSTQFCQSIWGIDVGEYSDSFNISVTPTITAPTGPLSTASSPVSLTYVDLYTGESSSNKFYVQIDQDTEDYSNICAYQTFPNTGYSDLKIGCVQRPDMPASTISSCSTATHMSPCATLTWAAKGKSGTNYTASTTMTVPQFTSDWSSLPADPIVYFGGASFSAHVVDSNNLTIPYQPATSSDSRIVSYNGTILYNSMWGNYLSSIMPSSSCDQDTCAIYLDGLEYIGGHYVRGGSYLCIDNTKGCYNDTTQCVLAKDYTALDGTTKWTSTSPSDRINPDTTSPSLTSSQYYIDSSSSDRPSNFGCNGSCIDNFVIIPNSSNPSMPGGSMTVKQTQVYSDITNSKRISIASLDNTGENASLGDGSSTYTNSYTITFDITQNPSQANIYFNNLVFEDYLEIKVNGNIITDASLWSATDTKIGNQNYITKFDLNALNSLLLSYLNTGSNTITINLKTIYQGMIDIGLVYNVSCYTSSTYQYCDSSSTTTTTTSGSVRSKVGLENSSMCVSVPPATCSASTDSPTYYATWPSSNAGTLATGSCLTNYIPVDSSKMGRYCLLQSTGTTTWDTSSTRIANTFSGCSSSCITDIQASSTSNGIISSGSVTVANTATSTKSADGGTLLIYTPGGKESNGILQSGTVTNTVTISFNISSLNNSDATKSDIYFSDLQFDDYMQIYVTNGSNVTTPITTDSNTINNSSGTSFVLWNSATSPTDVNNWRNYNTLDTNLSNLNAKLLSALSSGTNTITIKVKTVNGGGFYIGMKYNQLCYSQCPTVDSASSSTGYATWTKAAVGAISKGSCLAGYTAVDSTKMSRSCSLSGTAGVLDTISNGTSQNTTAGTQFSGCAAQICTGEVAGNATWPSAGYGNSSTGTCNSGYAPNDSTKMQRACNLSGTSVVFDTVTNGISTNFAGCSANCISNISFPSGYPTQISTTGNTGTNSSNSDGSGTIYLMSSDYGACCGISTSSSSGATNTWKTEFNVTNPAYANIYFSYLTFDDGIRIKVNGTPITNDSSSVNGSALWSTAETGLMRNYNTLDSGFTSLNAALKSNLVTGTNTIQVDVITFGGGDLLATLNYNTSCLSSTTCYNDDAGNATWTTASAGAYSAGTCKTNYVKNNSAKMTRLCSSIGNGLYQLEKVVNNSTTSGNFAGCTLGSCSNDSAGHATWPSTTAGSVATGTCNSGYSAKGSMTRACVVNNNTASFDAVSADSGYNSGTSSNSTYSSSFQGCIADRISQISQQWLSSNHISRCAQDYATWSSGSTYYVQFKTCDGWGNNGVYCNQCETRNYMQLTFNVPTEAAKSTMGIDILDFDDYVQIQVNGNDVISTSWNTNGTPIWSDSGWETGGWRYFSAAASFDTLNAAIRSKLVVGSNTIKITLKTIGGGGIVSRFWFTNPY